MKLLTILLTNKRSVIICQLLSRLQIQYKRSDCQYTDILEFGATTVNTIIIIFDFIIQLHFIEYKNTQKK